MERMGNMANNNKKSLKRSTREAKRFLKRDIQPCFPTGMKVSKAESIMIIDFLTSQESEAYDRSFAAIVVNKDVAKDLLENLLIYIKDNDIELDGVDIQEISQEESTLLG